MNRSSFRRTLARIGTLSLSFIFVYSLSATGVLACSRVGELIDSNHYLVRFYAVISGALLFASVVLYFLRGRKGLWVVLVGSFFLVFHPAWFYGGGGGDCGRSMASNAKFITVLVAIGAAYQLRSWLIERSGPQAE